MMDLVGYDAAREHADHVFGAQYDDVRERYSLTRPKNTRLIGHT